MKAALQNAGSELDARILRRTLDSLREGIQILSPEWRYLYVNDAVARHGRKRPEELIGRTMLECYPGIEKTHVFSVLERCMHERRAECLENQFEYEDGQHAWFELRIEPCRDGLVVLSLDITQRKRLETTLERGYRLRALGEMATGVAHDLKNILNPLVLHVELLRRRLREDRDSQEILTAMTAVLGRGTETIDLLRGFGRQSPPAPVARVELNAIAREAVRLCLPRATQQTDPVAITEELDDVPPISVNASELLSSILNLLVNAVDALPRGGTIAVRSGCSGEGVWLAVRDDGVGMPAEVQARASEPFFTTKGEAGTGLGLALVYAFAARHGGSMRITTAPAEGTTVTLLFPPAGNAST